VKVLVLGGGAREHALAWRLSRDPDVSAVVVAPGNAGIAADFPCLSVDPLDPAEVHGLAASQGVDLTVVGPEAPLERGLADHFRRTGRPILGPSQQGAALECSKVESKRFMDRHGIPTAPFVVCDTLDAALGAVSGEGFGFPVVIKADGLAAGKGVVIAENRSQAEAAVRAAMVDRQFGDAGARLVIEQCLSGPEVSFFVLSDGERAVPLASAQDHKRIWDDDRGPNTGGMGAFAPSPLMTPDIEDFTMRRVVAPVIEGMRAEVDPYVGFLYVSLMLTSDGPKVIEFNVRFGDPEAQVVLPHLTGPFGSTLYAAATGRLANATLRGGRDRFVGVVLASRGYPARPESGRVIRGLEEAARLRNVLVFHAATRRDGDELVTAGGRVLTIVGQGATFEDAMATAYEAAGRIAFDGVQYRRDIGRKAIAAAAETRS
jgi:phosphoribosylamine--glycine ligase